MMRKKLVFIAFCLAGLTSKHILAEENVAGKIFNPVSNLSGVPFLTITPDARAGGMGDVGAATSPDVNSQFWNASKYAFNESKAGFSFSYTPWLRKLVNDIDLVNATGFYKLGSDNNQALSASLRYFSLGNIAIIRDELDPGYEIKPSELAVDLAYSRQLSKYYSMAVGIRYIYSDLSVESESQAGNAFAADISGYYSRPIPMGGLESRLGLGFNITNIGTKISYDGGNNSLFLPTNLRLGASYLFPIDEYNTLTVSGDLLKQMTPTPPLKMEGESDQDYIARLDDIKKKSPISAIFSSFSDAPGGFKEELQEVAWSLGAEYVYNKQFSVRAGYYNENQYKGNRKYFSMGAGFRLNMFSIDAAYLISTAQASPLDQTLRFSLSFDMDGLRSLVK